MRSRGDVNGDGFDDLTIGALTGGAYNNGKPYAGESYVIFGGDGFTSSVTQPEGHQTRKLWPEHRCGRDGW